MMCRARAAMLVWAAGGVLTGSLHAQERLRDPGWGDPFFSPYLAGISGGAPAAAAAGAGAAVDAPGVVFTLPVLGFAGAGETSPGAGAEIGPPLAERVPGWPACAASKPDITTIPRNEAESVGAPLGSWYTRTLDFGCFSVIIAGDQNPPDQSASGGAPLGESGSADLSYDDENSGKSLDQDGREGAGAGAAVQEVKGPPTLTVTIGSLPYSLTLDCKEPASRALCESAAGIRALGKQLVPVAGLPSR